MHQKTFSPDFGTIDLRTTYICCNERDLEKIFDQIRPDMNHSNLHAVETQHSDFHILLQLRTTNKETLLHLAVRRGHFEVFNFLLTVCNNICPDFINERDIWGWNYLHLAVLYNKPRFVKQILENGVDITAKNYEGKNAVHIAIGEKFVEPLKLILEANSNNSELVNAFDYAGTAPLHIAAENNFLQGVQLLLTAGADVDLPDRKTGRTCLHLAIIAKNEDVARFLITEAGADVNFQGWDQRTPLHWAVVTESSELYRLLLEQNAYRDLEDNEGKTPSDLIRSAAKSGEVRTKLSIISRYNYIRRGKRYRRSSRSTRNLIKRNPGTARRLH